MFGIDRYYRCAVLSRQPGHYSAGGYQGLLVRQGYDFSCLDGRYRRFQSAESHHGCEHNVYFIAACQFTYGFHPGEHFYIMRLQGFSDFLIFGFVAYHHTVRPEFQSLFYEQAAAVVCGEKFHIEKVAVLSDDIQGLPANRACGAENRYPSFFHLIRN